MRERVHAGHQGLNSCLRRARDLIFWPHMTKEITEFVKTCAICAAFPDKQAPEPLLPHEVPNNPWEKVGTDIYSIKNRNYLVTVDYLSGFFEVDYLPSVNSLSVISKLKAHFARYGSPLKLVSDNGSVYTSKEFREFTANWKISHETISPGNSQDNGAAEAAVKIAKKMMKRSALAKEDPYLALLNIRNTPTEGLSASPVQRSLGRRTRSMIPTDNNKLKPDSQIITESKPLKEAMKSKYTTRINASRRELETLKVGDNVRLQPIDGKTY